jgi:hypothetical protein
LRHPDEIGSKKRLSRETGGDGKAAEQAYQDRRTGRQAAQPGRPEVAPEGRYGGRQDDPPGR